MRMEIDKLLDIYTRILRIRRFEEEVGKLFAQGQLPGFVHLYIGEEAVGAGVCAALRDDDYIVSTHRGHGHVLAKGGDMQRMMAELFGKRDGYCKGKGGSMHIADFSIGMLGACGIVGGGIPVAVGAALSAKTRGTDQVAVTFFGDGAANEGSFHESLNLASALKLPVIFVCENNQYGEFTPATSAMNIKDIALRAQGYGIPGVIVDGTDAIAMYEAAQEAVARARRGEGPTLIEAKTHRRGGHAEGEDAFLAGQQYLLPEERDAMRRNDPLLKLHDYIVERKLVALETLETLDQEIGQAVVDAVAFARASE
ncbi:MAG TPA: pyruvate dehydrogenase (acetyl-transferring) E1 component subunit alpha, partial [Chloroflexi bacterium]|nr:pyruvate dehydrogenase (acetyl-transferring) E1 component subunit alpha [Chloroflexota bacterium]HHW87737.1 thiamine pyrophosphate-dependent dehydrogenase E1 component subunit alpha [Chloroflexota bacterium]